MSIQSVPLSSLQPPAANPRSTFDAATLDGLATSIKTDGLLQNLVVAPVQGSKRRYRVISGERRLRALKLLEKRGDIKPNYSVPVEIRSGLSKDDTLRIATIENLQREDLPPPDQSAALAVLIRKGTTLEDLVAKTGLSATTIKRRLALNGLCDDAAAALRDGTISLAQAEAVTLGTPEAQRDLLKRIAHSPDDYSASAIRECLLDEKPSVAMAIFPRDQYTGTVTTDLFQADEESFFDDAEQFITLQRQAVDELKRGYEGKAAWVEVTDSHRLPEWQYQKATKRNRKHAGVVINISPRGAVEVREGLLKPKAINRKTADETADSGLAAAKPKAMYPTPLRRYMGWHKTLAVQEVLLADSRRAREVAAIHELLGLRVHDALQALAKSEKQQISYEVIEAQAAIIVRLLGLEQTDGDPAWRTLGVVGRQTDDALDLYRRIKALSDAELDQLRLVVAVLPFGQTNCDRLDSGESLFNAVATDLKIDMRNHWRPDADFLNRRTREQLVALAEQCGHADGVSGLRTRKKTELVNALLRHFEQARQASAPNEAQTKAISWLPEAMLFPAIDPDAREASVDDEPPFDADDDSEAE
jgi:ParB family transcriptional regulator, chromosome partitioning protein